MPAPTEVDANVIIYCGKTSPLEVTRLLGIEPTKLLEVGKVYRHSARDGSPMIAKINGWFLESALPKSDSIERHVDAFLQMLTPTADGLAEIARWPETRMSIRCIVWLATDEDDNVCDGYEICVSPKLAAALGALPFGLEIGVR